MNERKPFLVIIGIFGLLTCVFACRPSWSPDGSKILFPYYDPKTRDVGLALHDLVAEETRSLFARRSARWDDRVVIGQWGPEGKRAVLFSGEKEILTLPLDRSRPTRRIEVPGDVLCGAGPWPVIGDRLFCCGERVFRIDLTDGSVVSRTYGDVDSTVILGAGESIIYLRFLDKGHDFVGYELGEVDPENLKTEPSFRLSLRMLEAHGIQELEGSIAFDPGEGRLAMTARTESGYVVLFLGPDGVESVLHPALPAEHVKLGNIQWARDSDRLLAAASTPGSKHGSTLLSLADIPLAGGHSKLYPVVELRKSYAYFEPFEIQIALSPDGTTVALATTYLDAGEVAVEDRALYLLALDQPSQPPNKIVWPPPHS